MDPLILRKLTDSTGVTRELGYDLSADIWSIGTICYEMFIGKSAFDSEDMEELVDKIEKGKYTVPKNISIELVSFLNGMLQYEGKNRLKAEQLSRHAFLTKDVKQFKNINLNEILNKIEDDEIELNTKEKNIIHRDVKPDNILLHYENEEDKKNLNLMKAQVKIIDFGFSCFLGPDGLRYTTLGSPLCMDPLLLKKLTSSSNKVRQLGYNQSADIWSIGTVCYEMLIGKPAFDAEDMTDLINKVENGSYKIPTTMSYEIVSFLNGMLQYSAKQRLTAAQLYRHDFLNKDVKQFKKINLEAISDRVSSGMIDVNAIHNTTIWSIFNAKSETLLSTILGAAFVKPVDKNEEQKLKIIEENTLLRLPTNGGIPENVEKKVTGMTKEELDKLDNAPQVKESNYVFSASIFDS